MLLGGIIAIPISQNYIAFGKILKEGFLVIYKKTIPVTELQKHKFDIIKSSGELLYGRVYNDVITKGIFEIVDRDMVSNEELEKIPPRYSMKTGHSEICNIMYWNGTDRQALPSECIGLDYQYIWDASSFIELIEDKVENRVNKYEEVKKKELQMEIVIENLKKIKNK